MYIILCWSFYYSKTRNEKREATWSKLYKPTFYFYVQYLSLICLRTCLRGVFGFLFQAEPQNDHVQTTAIHTLLQVNSMTWHYLKKKKSSWLGFRSRSKTTVFLQFLEKCQAAKAGLPFPVPPQNQQVVSGTCDQTLLLKAHKHL